MKDAGAGGLVWDEANLTEYITDPKKKVPGNKMVFPGLKKEQESEGRHRLSEDVQHGPVAAFVFFASWI